MTNYPKKQKAANLAEQSLLLKLMLWGQNKVEANQPHSGGGKLPAACVVTKLGEVTSALGDITNFQHFKQDLLNCVI